MRLKSGAQQQLGDDFAGVYAFLHSARRDKLDDPAIQQALALRYPGRQQACFLVDQLVYHEMFVDQ